MSFAIKTKKRAEEIWSPVFLGHQYLLTLKTVGDVEVYEYKDKNLSIVVDPPRTGCSCGLRSSATFEVTVIVNGFDFVGFQETLKGAFKDAENEIKRYFKAVQADHRHIAEEAHLLLQKSNRIKKALYGNTK